MPPNLSLECGDKLNRVERLGVAQAGVERLGRSTGCEIWLVGEGQGDSQV